MGTGVAVRVIVRECDDDDDVMNDELNNVTCTHDDDVIIIIPHNDVSASTTDTMVNSHRHCTAAA